jgi:hypothetical protein
MTADELTIKESSTGGRPMADRVLDGFFLPQLTAHELAGMQWSQRTVGTGADEIVLRCPVVTAGLIDLLCGRLLEAQAVHLAERPVMDIAESLGRAVSRWFDPGYRLRRLAEQALPVITGYAPEMVRRGLTEYLKTFRIDRLHRFLAQDLDNPLVLDGFQPTRAGGRSRAYGPRLITQVFSGNVPGLPAWNLVCSLLVKSAVLGKSASAEPLFPALFAASVAEEDPDLARCLAVVSWPGGAQEVERAAFARSDAVAVTGGQAAVEGVRARMPSGVPLIAYGHKVSFAVIGREALALNRYLDTARRAARDVSQYDQQGCLSPHALFVERSGAVPPRTFAAALAAEMARVDRIHPRGRLGVADSAAIEQVRADYEFRSYADPHAVELFASDRGTAWTVAYEDQPQAFVPSPLNRVVRVHPIAGIGEVEPLLAPVRRYLQSAGVACAPERLTGWAQVLGRCGVDRICAVGQMPGPAAGWHHDGHGSLSALIRWVDIEPTAEMVLESYDPELTSSRESRGPGPC